MFSSSLRNLTALPSATYIQNNYYGSSGMSGMYGNYGSRCCGSVFNMPYSGCMPMQMSMPMMSYSTSIPPAPTFSMPMLNIPMFSGFAMPWGGGYYGGCCGMGNRYFDMMMSMYLLQAVTNSFANLTENISNLSRPSQTSAPRSFSFITAPSSPTTSRTTPSSSSSSASSYRPSSAVSTNASTQLRDIGYNSEKGQSLAQTALDNAVGFTGYCAKYVRKALDATGLSNGMRADAYNYNYVLSHNSNFREISTDGLDLSSLPAGCILVYDRGQSGYSSRYGHVEITTGRGTAVSDGITNNIKQGARVYVPV